MSHNRVDNPRRDDPWEEELENDTWTRESQQTGADCGFSLFDWNPVILFTMDGR
jgi:hypothetical protein